MLDLTDVKNIKSILAQQGLSPQKKLGQHFLIDKRVLQKLLAAAGVSSSNIVAEVGAGVGTITVELAKRAEKVYAVEIDKNLIPILKSQINDFKNVNIINTDILHLLQGWSLRNHNLREKAIQQVLQGWSLQDLKIIGAIPYQITSPLIHHLLTQENPPCLIAIIVQKEVAEKITAQPPKATYLSNFVSFFGNAEVVGKPIPPSSFWPQPDVYSAIVKIAHHPKLYFSVSQFLSFSVFLHRGFSHPRKMLKKVFNEKLLAAAGISPTRRAETLTQQEWLRLFELSQKSW